MMGIAERREREKEGLRRSILDAARELFAREGYDRVTMRGIADAIEYSPTAIYQHFKDKDALVEALCHEDFGELLGTFQAGELPADPVERIQILGRAYTRFGLSHPNHYRFMFMSPFKGENHRPSVNGELSYRMLREAVADGIAKGRFRHGDVDGIAQSLWASLHGAIALLITYGADKFPVAPAVPDLVERVSDAMLRGLLADDDASRSR
jgi:AcrR family transcriptional regulator